LDPGRKRMISILLGVTLPEWLDVALVSFIVLGLALGIGFVGRWAFRLLEESSVVPHVARDVLWVAVEATLASLKSSLAGFDPADQRPQVEASARAVYAALPEVLTLAIRGRAVPVPLKLLIPESVFVGLVLKAHSGVDAAYDELRAIVETEYEHWRSLKDVPVHG
jgi:hypothetical protein